jgi:hypothetical protein
MAVGTVAARGLPGGRATRHSAQEATGEVTDAVGEEKTEGRWALEEGTGDLRWRKKERRRWSSGKRKSAPKGGGQRFIAQGTGEGLEGAAGLARVMCVALPAVPRRNARMVGAEEPGGWRWVDPVQCVFVCFFIFKLIQIWISQKWSSGSRIFLNKIWMCRYGNKEQIYSLEFSKIRNGIWIAIHRTKLSQIWLILNSRDYEALDFDRIWHVGP